MFSKHTQVNTLRQEKHRIDIVILVIVIGLALFGILMIFEASNVNAFHELGDKYHYIREQFTWFLLSVSAMIALSYVPYKTYYRLSVPILIGALVTLFAVFVPGIGVKTYGAHRWINLGFVNFQPSEITKLALIFYLSSWFSSRERQRLLAFLLLLGMIVGLVVLQPDLGTAVILCLIFIIMYFLSGAPLWQFGFLIPVVTTIGLLLSVLSPYRFSRVTTFLNPQQDPLGSSYHLRQILISFGSGGLWGVGLGASRQKYQFLPEATTDSIFAIIGEEMGFVGTALLMIIYFIFLMRLLKIAIHAPDKFGFLLGSGIFVYFALQTIINLGAMVAVLPLTGVPLPFLSYGGSHLFISMLAIGVQLNISRNSKSSWIGSNPAVLLKRI